MKSRVNLALAVAVALMIAFAHCELVKATGYTDEAAWRAAVGTYTFDDFESYADGTQIQNDTILGIQFDLLDDNATYPSVQNRANTGGPTDLPGTQVLLNDQDFNLPARGPFNFHPINASDAIYGVGLFNVGGDDTLLLSLFDAGGGLIESFVSPQGFGFVGIAVNTPAASARIDEMGGNGYTPIDHLQVSVLPIPEPTSVVLMSVFLGISTLGLRRR